MHPDWFTAALYRQLQGPLPRASGRGHRTRVPRRRSRRRHSAPIADADYLAGLNLKSETFTVVGYGTDEFITGSVVSPKAIGRRRGAELPGRDGHPGARCLSRPVLEDHAEHVFRGLGWACSTKARSSGSTPGRSACAVRARTSRTGRLDGGADVPRGEPLDDGVRRLGGPAPSRRTLHSGALGPAVPRDRTGGRARRPAPGCARPASRERAMCVATVFSLMTSARAISPWLRPSARRRRPLAPVSSGRAPDLTLGRRLLGRAYLRTRARSSSGSTGLERLSSAPIRRPAARSYASVRTPEDQEDRRSRS